MEFFRRLGERHEALKKKIHSTRIPLSKNGQRFMGLVYFTTPIIGGYYVMKWAERHADASTKAPTLKARSIITPVMPHSLQQVSAASFFPTAKELSSGVQWFKDHPVLAAAAATAVSVITYLNALELEAEAEILEEASASDVSRVPNIHRKPAPIRRRGSPSSEGKLSAAVSWCDEHGGSLTQVFEEESDSNDETRDDVAESFESGFQQHRALTGGLRKSVTTQQLEVVAAQSGSDAEADAVQTDSPQWGWYVPITPPQDHFHPSGRDSAVVAPCRVAGAAAIADIKTMRRTTSGHIG